MKNLADSTAVKREIDSYVTHFSGAPLLIGFDRNTDYLNSLALLEDDPNVRIIRASDFCLVEFPPNPSFNFGYVSNAAKSNPIIWVGAAQSIMLYGQNETEAFLVNLAGSSFGGPVVVLCPFCCNILDRIGSNYPKLGHTIYAVRSEERDIPTIYVYGENTSYAEKPAIGIKSMLRCLEDGDWSSPFSVVTSCDLAHLSNTMIPLQKGKTAYQVLCQQEPKVSLGTVEGNGSSSQWQKLASSVKEAGGLVPICERKLCKLNLLPISFPDFLEEDDDTSFLCFVALKVFFGNDNSYLGECLRRSVKKEDLIPRVYDTILEYEHNSKRFSVLLRQRRNILQSMEENSSLMKDFCERATIRGKDILWYLSDETEEERAALIHAICCYGFSDNELSEILSCVSPKLNDYLRQFTFDEFNTRVMESDASIRALLTDYFQRYKIQKLTNRQDPDFIELVEEEAIKRSFTKLQARSAIIKKLDKKNAQPYFFDALGVEYLAFMQSKAEEYGMQFECLVGHCNLPSITSKNKEFYDAFPPDSILKEEGLDELKHHGTKYDYRFTTEPLHLFEELSLLERDLKKMSSALATGKYSRIIILSDHGASRLAVTYQSENDKLELSEPGKHSGRCCPTKSDPQIPFAYFEDGFAVLANYERFKGSRKADVETHGGASLEETVVPVIVLTLKPKEQQLFFTDTVVTCSPKDGSCITMFANPPLKAPRMMIGENSYAGEFAGDKHNISFVMPDIKRKGHHEAIIFDGSTRLATLEFDTKRQTGANQLI